LLLLTSDLLCLHWFDRFISCLVADCLLPFKKLNMIEKYLEKLDVFSFAIIIIGLTVELAKEFCFGGSHLEQSGAMVLCDHISIMLMFFGAGINAAVSLIQKQLLKTTKNKNNETL